MANELTSLEKREIYSDLFMDLNKHPVTNKLLRKVNVEAVKQSIRNIVLTDRGERLYNPEFGGNIQALLFENMTPQVFIHAEQYIRNTIEAFEPRAEIVDLYLADTLDDHGVQVTIIFRIINIQEPIQLDIVLERVR